VDYVKNHRSLLFLYLLFLPLVLGGREMLATGSSQDLTKISTAWDGGEANNTSFRPSVSSDGARIAFVSQATNLVENDSVNTCDLNFDGIASENCADIFVYDRQTGETHLVSISSAGNQANGESSTPILSGNGRFVAFVSTADNLVMEDTNGVADVFVHDLDTGMTVMASLGTGGEQGQYPSLNPAISADGSLVAFQTFSPNLVPEDGDAYFDVFVRDLANQTTELISVSTFNTKGNDDSGVTGGLGISADGRYVVFDSWAHNLVNGDTNNTSDIFLRDRLIGTTSRLSRGWDGSQPDGSSGDPSISADGMVIAFSSRATNLIEGDANTCRSGPIPGECQDIFLYDRMSLQTLRLSVSSSGEEANDESGDPVVSGNGLFVSFWSYASNLVPGDVVASCDTDNDWEYDDNCPDVFVYDITRGEIILASATGEGIAANHGSQSPAISDTGVTVVFESNASNLSDPDNNGFTDIFAHRYIWQDDLFSWILP
jgi:Tol biopolymer transport system component